MSVEKDFTPAPQDNALSAPRPVPHAPALPHVDRVSQELLESEIPAHVQAALSLSQPQLATVKVVKTVAYSAILLVHAFNA